MDKKIQVLQILVVIFAICIVGLVGYIVYDKLNDNKEPDNPSSEVDENKPNEDENKPNEDENTGDESEPPIVQEEKEEININDKIAKNILDKFDFNSEVLSNLYEVGEFSKDNIPNYLILRTAFAYASLDDSGKQVDKGDGEFVFEVSTKTLEKYIKDIFGNVNYTHQSFDLGKFRDATIMGPVTYSDGIYSSDMQFLGGFSTLQYAIIEHPYKAELVNDGEKINIYVKTVFNDWYYDEALDQFKITAYNNYDYDNYKYLDDIFYIYGQDDTLPEAEFNKYFDNNYDKINSYIYTFEKQADGNYYLSGFKKA